MLLGCQGSISVFLYLKFFLYFESEPHFHQRSAKYSGSLKTLLRPVQFSHSVMSDSLQPHGLQHARFLSPSAVPRAYSNSCPSSGYAIQPSYPLLSPSPPAFNLSPHQGLSQGVSSSHQVAKVLEFQLQHWSFQSVFSTDFF